MYLLLFLLSILPWFLGYFLTKGLIADRATLSSRLIIISPPKWVYFLCGAPKSPNYPAGSMTSRSFRLQVIGFVFSIYLFCTYILQGENLVLLIGLFFIIVLPYAITSVMERHYKTEVPLSS